VREKGVWRVPEFGVPGDARQPMILTAHRWGYKRWWGSGYWKYHSFYELPQLEPGDRVEIITQQRKYVYEVYKAEESSEITDYQASVILYTCKFLNASVRHIRYLRLIDPERDTQK
jgi:sortase (surface protein transpeptidase)